MHNECVHSVCTYVVCEYSLEILSLLNDLQQISSTACSQLQRSSSNGGGGEGGGGEGGGGMEKC